MVTVNDVEEIGVSGVDTDNGSSIELVKLGLPYSGPSVSSLVYIDDFKLNRDMMSFEDGFESGDLSNWDYTVLRDGNNVLEASTVNPSNGDYSLKAYTNGDLHDFTFVYDQGSSYDTFYSEFMLYVDHHNITSNDDRIYFLFGTDIVSNEIITLGWKMVSGSLRWVLGVRGATDYYGSCPPELDTWYHVRVYWQRGSNGNFTVTVDGLQEISETGVNTDRGSPIELVKLGLPYSGPRVSALVYIDDFLMHSEMESVVKGYTYDDRGRLILEGTQVGGDYYEVSYSYNNVSAVTGIIYPDDSVLGLSYDGLGRLNNINGYASLNYTLLDQPDTIKYGNNRVTKYTYDTRSRPTNIDMDLLDLTYTYDKTGSVTSINNGTYTEYYTYDLLDRLNQTVGPWGTIDYLYDPVGNRLSRVVQGGSSTTYTYDSMDRLTGATGMAFDWDVNGNMLYRHDGSNAWNYTYDPVNRLKRVEKDGVLSALYTYDAGGRRVRSWDTVSGLVDYVYSGLNIIDEVSGGTHEKHIYAGGMHIASNTSGVVEYYHVDHLGSTRLKTAMNGSAIYESNYEPFGPSSGESGNEDYRYTGKHEDPSGLYYYGARYYDPLTGRFTSRDTVMGDLSDPQSQNRYIYCRNNPHKFIDQDGRDYIPAEELNQLKNYVSMLPPEEQILLLVVGGMLLITSHAKQEADRQLNAEIAGRMEQFNYLAENDWDYEGSVTHYDIGKEASYVSSPLGVLGGGVKGAVKRKLQQKAFLEEKPGIDQYPPDYTEEDFVLDTFLGLSTPKSNDPVVVPLINAWDRARNILVNHVRDRWYESTASIMLPVPPDYVDAAFR